MAPKILIVTLKFPFPSTGACELDCASGISQFLRLGFDVKVITKITHYQSPENVQAVAKKLDIEIIPVTYKFDTKAPKIKKLWKYFLRFFKNPLILDGAAFEYNDPEMKDILRKQLADWQPDLVWFDCTQMWPLYGIVRKHKIPIMTRSQNFEPIHFLEEHGLNPINYLRFLPKLFSEIMTIKNSNVIFAITPKEAKIYKKLGAKNVEILPLRGLPKCLKVAREMRERERLNVFFMGSSYNVSHMKKALEFILKEIVPRANKLVPDKFCFHIFGGKFPKEYNNYLGENVVYRGYVENLESALDDMDIALIPSFFGAGMQQKIFEPLARGIPTITSLRGTAGYPFEHDRHLLLASNADEFIKNLIKLQDINLRKNLSWESSKLCNQIFSQKSLDSLILKKVNKHVRHQWI